MTRGLLVAFAVVCSGCNLLSDTAPTAATTNTFAGTLGLKGSVVFTFTVAQPGTVTVALSSLGTTSAVGVGLGVGTSSAGIGCTLTTSTSAALPSALPQISVTLAAGTHCVELFDVGDLTSAAAFTILVTHL